MIDPKLPERIDTDNMTDQEYYDFLIHRTQTYFYRELVTLRAKVLLLESQRPRVETWQDGILVETQLI